MQGRGVISPRLHRPGSSGVLCALLVLGTGCSTVKRTAVNQLGDALASGGSVYASDDDPELIRAAAPFSLKLMESLLAESPQHRGLLLAAASGFTQYGYAFVQQDADQWESTDLDAADRARDRARRLFLRARDYGLRGLEVSQAGFTLALRDAPTAAVRACRVEDVPFLYWTAAAWAAAIAVKKDRPDLIAQLPQVEALLDRALELDETFAQGALHTLMISYEMARQGGAGNPEDRALQHFKRAVELGPNTASPYVTLAESVCVQKQDRARFEELLRQALAVDADAYPETRLVTLILQRRARWLLERVDELFLPPEPSSKTTS